MGDACGRCNEEHGALQETKDGGLVCPPCIRKEAARHQDSQEERRRRTEVTRERGRWVER